MNSNKHAFAVIFSIFSPRNHNFNILGKYEHTVIHTECKKSEQVRKKELRSSLYQPLLNYLSDNQLYHLLRHHINNKLIIAIYKSLEEGNLQVIQTTLNNYSVTSFPESPPSSFKMQETPSKPKLSLKVQLQILALTKY